MRRNRDPVYQREFALEQEKCAARLAALALAIAPAVQEEGKPLRPKTWSEYVGQDSLRERLQLHAEAAVKAHRRMDHVLLIGPPGSGKTTLSAVIAQSMNVPFKSYMWPLEFDTLQQIVSSGSGVVLLDEIHRGTPARQEWLLPLIEDDYIQLKNGARIQAGGRLTIVGATTEPDRVITPLFDRFPIKPAFDDYSDDEMAQIVTRMAQISGATLDSKMALELGKATGGVPRNAESFITTLRDMQEKGVSDTTAEVLRICRVRADGLTQDHQDYLATLRQMGGTAGLRMVATHMRKPEPYVRDLERLLVKKGLIRYGERGRVLQ